MSDPNSSFLNTVIPSKLDAKTRRAQANAAGMARLLEEIRGQEAAIREGGGSKGVESQHNKKRLTARERLALLLDEGSEFFELGLFAAFGMYEEWGGAPSAGC